MFKKHLYKRFLEGKVCSIESIHFHKFEMITPMSKAFQDAGIDMLDFVGDHIGDLLSQVLENPKLLADYLAARK